jgi:hypothetical protein
MRRGNEQMRDLSYFTHEEYELMKMPLARGRFQTVPLLHFLPGSKGNACWWMTGKTWEGSPFAGWMQRLWRRSLTSSLLFSPAVPTSAKLDTIPGFYLLVYRDVEKGWKSEEEKTQGE